MQLKRDILKDIIDWDIENWSKAIDFWDKNISIKNKNYQCLELGSRKGGLSLWLALNGNSVICSDINSPEKEASIIHKKYECHRKIKYESIDATKIPYHNHFDVIAFKSILGGISRDKRNKMKKKVVGEIHKALKPGGKLIFAENLEASIIHKYLRKYFTKWGSHWNYFRIEEINDVFSSYKSINYVTVGFLGAFGRNEEQRKILGRVDRIVEKMIPQKNRYILIGIAEK